MPGKDVLLALLVSVIWGLNFVVADVAVDEIPPLLFAALRFTFVALPAVFFVKPPKIGWRRVTLVGLTMGAGQFGLLFAALAIGMPPGLASLVIQAQAFLTVALAAVFLHERPRRVQILGIAIGFAGLLVVAFGRSAGAPLIPFLMVVGAAACWATGNVITSGSSPRSALSLVVWSGLAAPLPLLATSLVLEGPAADLHAITHLSLIGIAAVAYVAIGASLVGYGIWAALLGRHTTSSVTPYALLVPVVGIATAWIVTDERPGAGEIAGAVVILVGVLITSLSRPTRVVHR